MDITIDDIIARYGREIAALTQRAVLAEAQRDAYKAELDEHWAETEEDA